MIYKFEPQDKNYEDYASGRVLFNRQGSTSFPVRLASEIFQRSLSILSSKGRAGAPCTIYDPCCGGAYLLTVLGILHGERISCIFASDINQSAVAQAEKNLSLLSLSGIDRRIEQLKGYIDEYGKASHISALESAVRLRDKISRRKNAVEAACFAADITKEANIKNITGKVDMVITDLPYGNIVHWNGLEDESSAVDRLMSNILPCLTVQSVAAVISDKKITLSGTEFKRVEHFKAGKRHVAIYHPANQAIL